jgi:hypothetical protein
MLTILFTKLNLLFFAAPGDRCDLSDRRFFFIDPWWKYLNGKYDQLNHCTPVVDFIHNPTNVWLIGLALIDGLLRIAGFLAVVSIIIAGAELVLSEGSPEKATAARNRILNSLVGLAIAASATMIVSFLGARLGGSQRSGLPHVVAGDGALNTGFNILFSVLGAIAFLLLVVAGLRFVMSRGEPSKIADARRQILYAALGLVVIAVAAAIVNFVLNRL